MPLGLQEFVNRKESRGAPPFQKPIPRDRQDALGLKFSTKPTVNLLNKTSDRGYAPNEQTTQNTYDHSQPLPRDINAVDYTDRGLHDTEVSSDFDRTRSDVVLEDDNRSSAHPLGFGKYSSDDYVEPEELSQEDYGQEMNIGPSHDYTQHNSAHHPNVSFGIDIHQGSQRTSQSRLKTGRFQVATSFEKHELLNGTIGVAVHPGYHVSMKRSPSPQRHNNKEENDLLIDQSPLQAGDTASRGESEQSSDDTTRNLSPLRPKNLKAMHGLLQDPHIPPAISEYDDKTLQAMNYDHLKNEPWEGVSHPQNLSPVEKLASPPSLEQQIQQHVNAIHENEGARASAQEFFAQLSSKQWDEAGEIFVGKFASLMHSLQAQRRYKREVVARFESEIEEREVVVRRKSECLDKKFKDMRASGENILNGK